MPLAISLLMGTCASPDCHKWQPPSADHWSQSHQLTQGHQHTGRKTQQMNERKWKTDEIGKGITCPLRSRYLDLQQQQKSWPATKWRSGIKISKRKYVVTNEKQWWWATSINIITQWNHNIIIYQCWNWSNWAKLISQNVMWCAITQWSTIAKVNSWPQWSVVLLSIPK